MKNLIPLFLAILFIGAGCVFQKPEMAVDSGEAIVTPRAETFVAVVTAFDDATKTATVELADGSSEQAQAGAVSTIDASSVGTLFSMEGTRDPSTRIVDLSSATKRDQNLIVVSPEPKATVTSPLVVTGFGRVFEQQFGWRIKDSTGAVVATGSAMTHAADAGQFGPFSFEVFLPALTSQSFTLQAFDASPKDGTDQDVVTVALNLLSLKTTDVSVFFRNPRAVSKDCSAVYPVPRKMAETSAVGRASVYELLKGPTADEKALGLMTSIPSGVALKSLVISNREAKADFSADLRITRNACVDDSVRHEIQQTLEQFDTVDSVEINVDGNPFGKT